MTGRIERLLDHHAVIRSNEDGRTYFMFRRGLAQHHAAAARVSEFADLQTTMPVEFTPVEPGRTQDRPVALDVRVTGPALSSDDLDPLV